MCSIDWPAAAPSCRETRDRGARLLAAERSHSHIGVMQHLDLTDEEAAALIKEIADITGNDRDPFSARIKILRAILSKLRSEPVREPLHPPPLYTPPRATASRRRRRG